MKGLLAWDFCTIDSDLDYLLNKAENFYLPHMCTFVQQSAGKPVRWKFQLSTATSTNHKKAMKF